jgi:predicted component of type VI protein secretion system
MTTAGVLGGLHSASPVELKLRHEAERLGEPFVIYRDGDGTQLIVPLPQAPGRITIGRRPSNDIVLDFDKEVSRTHVELLRIGRDWCLVDHGLSRNGSFVNQDMVIARVKLRDGDVIRLGRTLLLFRAPAADHGLSEPTATTAQAAAARRTTGMRRRVLVALCRPLAGPGSAPLPTNREIAEELSLSEQAVKANLRALFSLFGVQDEPQNRKRRALAEAALRSGSLSPAELEPPRS